MSDPDTQPCPTAKIQRRLRANEALMEMVRTKRGYFSPAAGIRTFQRRLVPFAGWSSSGLKAKSK